MTTPRRFEVHLVNLDPMVGAEMRKTRPCVVLSPDVMNQRLQTLVVAPMTSRVRRYPNRVRLSFQGQDGELALDQICTVDRSRLVRHLGELDQADARRVASQLVAMFAF